MNYNPGPSEPYPKFNQFFVDAINEQVHAISHRSAEFKQLYADTAAGLRALMNIPADYHIWFVASATEAMERIIQNTVEHTSHHVITGAFADRFAKMATELGKTVSADMSEWGSAINLDEIDVPERAELIAITQTETSTGVAIDPAAISRLAERYPHKLIAVDVVSSVPFVELDIARTDLVFFSVQKGFGLPAGLGVIIASPRALQRSRELQAKGQVIGTYHSFPELAAAEAKHFTPETPNVVWIYLLNRVIQDLLASDINLIRSQISAQAEQLYQAIDEHPELSPLVDDPAARSHTVIIAEVAGGNAPVMDALSGEGHHLGSGYAHLKDSHIRIANFPAHLGTTDELLGHINRWQK